MKFGKSTEEAMKEPARGGSGGGDFMKYLTDGDNWLHIIDEPANWVWYWEHFNPEGFPFPCTSEDDCPGCTSDNEKMSKVSRRVALNAYNGEYTNVWKLPKTVADKLKNRFERIGSITDRPYIITRLKTGTGQNAKYDFDLEGQDKAKLPDGVHEHVRDPEELLVSAYEDAWGSSGMGRAAVAKADQKTESKSKMTLVKNEESSFKETPKEEKPPFEQPEQDSGAEKVVTEEELRAMETDALRILCESEGFGEPPLSKKTSDAIVDWMLDQN